MRRQDLYQYSLVFFALLVLAGVALFGFRELFPEYRVYQSAYKHLEKIRSTYSHEKPAPFQSGIKQILITKGSQEVVDRCVSCHLAMDLPHFSPTSPDYVWDLPECENMKWIKIDGKEISLERVIQMHPLIGDETRPFEYHPMDKYGCTSCHSGNGRGLVAKRAHGPVFDGEYEPALSTFKPQFTEVDSQNDPLFSRMYNDKPGHDLIFQTKPILAGPLVEAACVQCHQPAVAGQVEQNSTVDCFTTNYQRGQELFISQACYACHRIAGFSRNNVGPELTKIGLNYPWYIKESIVWPQADLPSSTMPNFRLDHEELGALMTFLMAQKGETRAIADIDYQIQVSRWEKGEKMAWEEPTLPTDIQNIQAAKLVFASEGCASCHKLKGFDSKVYLRGEDADWFCHLIPERITGSELAKIVEAHGAVFDEQIQVGSASGVLEEIEERFPDLIWSFYTNFKFAFRAYDTVYQKDELKLASYKDRLAKVLKVYIQEYGLGREIAPRLNWSGVWRDDEWLIGHFRNPSLYTPKSLMPSMPFDDTKFFMLNNMLHAVGQQNRNQLREVWKKEGFSPQLCFERLCSSCHGQHAQGNGVVAEWIFPIPKNLRDPVFLHTLSKERAIASITHGVKGTPMPPWGESALQVTDQLAVLTASEIRQLADWLFQDVAATSDEEPRKWAYMPVDVIKEMKKERAFLELGSLQEESVDALVQAYFEERANTLSYSPDPSLFYIRDTYYTPQILQEAEQFFTVNCAICHGKEGAGTGPRASSMVEAKPRVFTDIPWIRAQDDLFLLRSIKYGVPGTAMVAWGDQTTAAQRMGLVMFIRSLSRSALQRDELQNILYQAFDVALLALEESRASEYVELQQLEEKLRAEQIDLAALTTHSTSASDIGKLCLNIHHLQQALEKAKQVDSTYLKINELLKEQKTIFAGIGEQIIAAGLSDKLMQDFTDLLLHDSQTFFQTLEETSQDAIHLKTNILSQLSAASKLRTQQHALLATLKKHSDHN
jgi:mono/diheme cytochrome c family protein